MEVEKGEIIMLSDNKEYVCLSAFRVEGKKYLYLMTTKEPVEFCFVEETVMENGIKMRMVGSREEKHKLFELLKSQVNVEKGL